MEKIWLKQYPPGVNETIDVEKYESIPDFIACRCEKYADLIAFENFGSQITFKEFDELSLRFAAFLQQRLGLVKGDRFAIMLPNIIQFPIAMYGALRAGLILVNVNPLYTVRELSHQLKDAGAKAIIVMENFTRTLEEALPLTGIKYVVVTKMGDCLGSFKGALINGFLKYVKAEIPKWNIPCALRYKDLMMEARDLTFEPVKCNANDIAFLQYTGGTTGVSKGAMLTHRNIIANIMQCLEWVKATLKEGTDTVVTALPLYHIFALTGCYFFMAVGSKALLITNPRDIKLFIRILRRVRFSVFVGINTLYNGLMHQSGFSKIDFSHLTLAIQGGMALQRAVAEQWQQKTRSMIIEGFGLTEASPVVTINPTSIVEFNGSVGLPVSSTEVSVRDHQGNEVPLGENGEIWVRGPQVMKGYWHKRKATAHVLDDQGWLRTGDIARMDEQGFVFIVDREKDMIIVSGFNVYPNEIEDVLMSHPAVKEVAVIGVPCEKTGERVKAFIVPENGVLTKEEVTEFCLERLTKYKIPKIIEFVSYLPKSNVGKVLRRELRGE